MAGAFRRVPIWITVSGLALFLSGVALFIGTIDTCAGVVLGAPPTAKIDADGTLRLAGSINATLVAAARKAIGQAGSPVRKVDLDSYGGFDANMYQLANLLRSLDTVIEVAWRNLSICLCWPPGIRARKDIGRADGDAHVPFRRAARRPGHRRTLWLAERGHDPDRSMVPALHTRNAALGRAIERHAPETVQRLQAQSAHNAWRDGPDWSGVQRPARRHRSPRGPDGPVPINIDDARRSLSRRKARALPTPQSRYRHAADPVAHRRVKRRTHRRTRPTCLPSRSCNAAIASKTKT